MTKKMIMNKNTKNALKTTRIPLGEETSIPSCFMLAKENQL